MMKGKENKNEEDEKETDKKYGKESKRLLTERERER